jgi:LuxR family transcriptional regulator, maltose regulon positive regulatory protein
MTPDHAILANKLFVPPARPNVVPRPRLSERLNGALTRRLTLISAPAGFGKTTLVSEWVAGCGRPVAWLSLDEGDKDPARFLVYLIAALQTIAPDLGAGILGMLQSPQPPSPKAVMTALLNELTTVQAKFILVLDDYHLVRSNPIDQALTMLVDHSPPQMHVVIATREEPTLPLSRLRARSQLAELRAADLRFTPSEAAVFLNQVMGLNLKAEEIALLETRTEGWVAGLQLAAISMQGQQDTARFLQAFTGSHRYVLDYLVEEVLHQQPERVQTFLLHTAILDRLCGPLCEALLLAPQGSGQATLEEIERANLFIVPLDQERRWYRYHHLFADVLRQRLHQSAADVNEYHKRASQWFEAQRLGMEAFHHAAAANDVERAERLMDGNGISRHDRGAVTAILAWLESLPEAVLNARPSLWWRHASLLLVNGHTTGVEEKLQAAEAALQGSVADDKTRNLIGQIAAARATLALTRYEAETMLAQSLRALAHLHPSDLTTRTSATWTLGLAHYLRGNRIAAGRAFAEAITLGQASGDTFTTILATIGLGNVQEAENQLQLAARTYRHVLHLAGDQPLQIVYEAHLGLARVLYEWNDLDAAEQHGRQSLHLALQYEDVIDRYIVCEIFLARLKLVRGDASGAAAMLAKTSQSARRRNFVHRLPEIAAAQVLTLLRQGDRAAAAQLADTFSLSASRARVLLVRGEASAAIALLEPLRQQAEAKGWADERLRAMVLLALAYRAGGEQQQAMQLLGDALTLAEPADSVRLFADEGRPMAELLCEAAARGMKPGYTGKLLAVLESELRPSAGTSPMPEGLAGAEPLTQRECEVLQLIAQGLSNQQIGERLFLALDTVKGHNRRIYEKLQVQRRTEAVARARHLGLV